MNLMPLYFIYFDNQLKAIHCQFKGILRESCSPIKGCNMIYPGPPVPPPNPGMN